MSNYTKSTNFAVKDGLSVGTAAKRVRGTEIDDEYNAISVAIATKANTNNAALTGVPTAPTASAATNSTQLATTAYATTAIAAIAFPSTFAAGTKLVFYQASAPTGWTKVTSHNDKALRVVSGSGGGSGGSTSFSSAFTHSHSDSFSVNNHTLTISQIPSHTHYSGWKTGSGDGSAGQYATLHEGSASVQTGSAGSGAAHNHGLSGSVSSATISPQYVDVIICSKD